MAEERSADVQTPSYQKKRLQGTEPQGATTRHGKANKGKHEVVFSIRNLHAARVWWRDTVYMMIGKSRARFVWGVKVGRRSSAP